MRRGLDPRVLLPGALLLVLLGGSCADTYAQGNAPPATSFYYPTTVAVLPQTTHPDRFALVSSSNFDLRFNAGWLSVVDLKVLLDPSTATPSAAGLVHQQLRVPSFAGPIAARLDTALAAGETRLAFIAHRGTRLVTVVEISAASDGVPHLSCGVAGSTLNMGEIERRTDCDLKHFFDLSNPTGFDATVDPQDLYDPYAITLFTDELDGTDHLALSFLSRTNSDTMLLTFGVGDASSGFLHPEHAVKLGAATIGQLVPLVSPSPDPACKTTPADTCVRTRLIAGNRVYGSGTDSSLLRVVTITGTNGVVVTNHYLSTDVGGTAITGLTLAPDRKRAYVVNRSPDSLVSLDMTLATPADVGSTTTTTSVIDQPRFGVVDVLPLGSEPQDLLYLPRTVPLLTVPRFRARELDVVAAPGAALVSVAVVTNIGSGPFGSTTWTEASGGDLVLVSTFFDHGLSVVRIPSGDPGAASLISRVRSADLGDATTY
jgi:hypothetical protein